MRPAYFLAALASVAGTHANPEPDLAGTIWDDIKGAVTCAGCEGLLGALKLAAGLGQSALENIVTGACKLAAEAYGSLLTPPVTDPTVEMTPAFWHQVTAQMEKDDSVFQAWWARTTRGYNVTECTGDCAKTKICSLRGGDAQFNCEGAGTPFKITKRSDGVSEVHVERPFCEDAVLARIVGGLTRKGVDAEKYVREQAKLYEKV
ncbi:hypothetical protein APSETT444_000725 [Aspergillus pseudonomiae]